MKVAITKEKLLKKLGIKEEVFDYTLKLFDKDRDQNYFIPKEVDLFISYLKSTNQITECLISKNDYDIVEPDVDGKADISIISKQRKIAKTTIKKNIEKMTCKGHQSIAIADIIQELAVNDRCQYISHCGTGKTFVSQKVVEESLLNMEKSIVLILLPSLDLLSQFFASWKSNTSFSSHLKPYILCSDDEIINGDGINSKNDYLSEMKNCFVNDLAAYLESDIEHKLVFSTYHSVPLMSAVLEDLGLYVDISVFDEAHKTTGEFNKSFSYALYDHNIKIVKRLFMTATQKINPYSSNSLTMGNELIYGKVAHRLSMREAIDQGIVRDYQIVIVTIDKDALSEENIADPESRRHLMMHSLSKVIKEKNIKNGIVFQRTIQDSKSFVDLANSSGCFPGFEITHVDGTMKTSTRKRHIGALSNEKPTILSNSKLLSEGIDTPVLDMVGFLNPIKSLVDIVQRLGRTQRKQSEDDERKGYLFLPLFVGSGVDFLNTDAEDLENWNFVIDILSILREVDNKFKMGIEYYKYHKTFPDEIVDFVFDSEETKEKYNASIIASLVDNIKISYYEHLNTNWDKMYNELKAFISEYKRMPKFSENAALEEWCSTQKKKRKDGMLSDEKQNLLDDIGFIWNKFDHAWEEGFKGLKSFYEENKREPVGKGSNTQKPKKEADAAKWLGHQKNAYRKGLLSEDRIERLRPYVKSWDLAGDKIWEEQFNKFKNFILKNKKFPMDQGDEQYIYRWVNKQKTIYEAGELKQEYVDRLDGVYKDWSLTGKDRLWKAQYALLEKFLEEFKKTPFIHSDDQQEVRIATWFAKQRRLFAGSSLNSWQVEMLQQLTKKHSLEIFFTPLKKSCRESVLVDFKYSGKERWITARDYEEMCSLVKFGTSNLLKKCREDGVEMSKISKTVEKEIFINIEYILEVKAAYDEMIQFIKDKHGKGLDYSELAKAVGKRYSDISRYFERLFTEKENKNLLTYLSISKFTAEVYAYLKLNDKQY